MKKPFLRALGGAVYIVLIVLLIQFFGHALSGKQDTIIIPMVMLSLFVLSAATMGYLFLSEPLYLLSENRKQDAITFFAKTVGIFACFGLLFAVLLFVNPFAKNNPDLDVRLNINVVCENALTYMTFPNGGEADKFVAECKEGKHPEVIEHYKAQMNLNLD